jgi:quercetin dioxygenase-like cupin family protein
VRNLVVESTLKTLLLFREDSRNPQSTSHGFLIPENDPTRVIRGIVSNELEGKPDQDRSDVLLLAACLVPVFSAQGQFPVIRTSPEEVRWVPNTDGSGVERATMDGDPSKPGLYVIRVKFPPGGMSLNHFHPEDRHVVVIKGTRYAGIGGEFLPDKTIPLKPGAYMKHPANVHHFDGAKEEEVILQIVGWAD